jgi:hypothetical protein
MSGKLDYLNPPFPDSKSMAWQFFTDDDIPRTSLPA